MHDNELICFLQYTGEKSLSFVFLAESLILREEDVVSSFWLYLEFYRSSHAFSEAKTFVFSTVLKTNSTIVGHAIEQV